MQGSSSAITALSVIPLLYGIMDITSGVFTIYTKWKHAVTIELLRSLHVVCGVITLLLLFIALGFYLSDVSSVRWVFLSCIALNMDSLRQNLLLPGCFLLSGKLSIRRITIAGSYLLVTRGLSLGLFWLFIPEHRIHSTLPTFVCIVVDNIFTVLAVYLQLHPRPSDGQPIPWFWRWARMHPTPPTSIYTMLNYIFTFLSLDVQLRLPSRSRRPVPKFWKWAGTRSVWIIIVLIISTVVVYTIGQKQGEIIFQINVVNSLVLPGLASSLDFAQLAGFRSLHEDDKESLTPRAVKSNSSLKTGWSVASNVSLGLETLDKLRAPEEAKMPLPLPHNDTPVPSSPPRNFSRTGSQYWGPSHTAISDSATHDIEAAHRAENPKHHGQNTTTSFKNPDTSHFDYNKFYPYDDDLSGLAPLRSWDTTYGSPQHLCSPSSIPVGDPATFLKQASGGQNWI